MELFFSTYTADGCTLCKLFEMHDHCSSVTLNNNNILYNIKIKIIVQRIRGIRHDTFYPKNVFTVMIGVHRHYGAHA